MTQGDPGFGSTGPKPVIERLEVLGEQLVDKIKELVHEGNVKHIVIRHEDHIVLEIPVGLTVIGVVLAPVLAAVGAIGAIVTHCTVEVIRKEE